MFEIAVCDDDKEFMNAFEAQLTAALEEAGVPGHIVCYTDCGALLDAVRGGQKYDLLFLDILFGREADALREMGVSMARTLREMGAGADIIFMSTTPDFAVDSFDVSPLHYLLKPIEAAKLQTALARFLDRNRPGSLSFSSPRGILRILLSDILYFEIYGHEILIHQKGGSCDTCTGTLKELEAALPARSFVRPHRSYLVNLDHVTEIFRYRMRMDDGEFIPISKNLYRQTQESFIEYADGSCVSF